MFAVKIVTSLALVLALTISVGAPVCCAIGDCCHVEQPVEHATCGCCAPEPKPASPNPPCDCDDHDMELSTPPHQSAFDHDSVAVLDLDTAFVHAIPESVPQASEALTRPTAPHAGLTLPLLL